MKYLLTVFITVIFFVACSQSAKILHYSEAGEYDHGTHENSFAMFQGLAKQYKASVVDDQAGHEFNNIRNLSRYDLVVFSNTSGSDILNPTQRVNFEIYIKAGGSYLGIHSAANTYVHSSVSRYGEDIWDWYAETVSGCSVAQNPSIGCFKRQETIYHMGSYEMLNNLPEPWIKTDCFYSWSNGYVNGAEFSEVLSLYQTSADPSSMVAHVRELPGGGKAFYTSLGHSRSNFQRGTMFIELMNGALAYLLDETPVSLSSYPAPQSPEELGMEIYLSNDILYVKAPGDLPRYRLEVVNVIGQSIALSPDLDLRGNAPGVYVVRVHFLDGLVVYKKIIKR